MDIYPTILDLIDLDPKPYQHEDGVSLFLNREEKSEKQEQRTTLFWHYPHYNKHPQSAPVSIIRKANWKLIEFLETGDLELFDLSEDPGEQKDLSETEVAVTARLFEELLQWRSAVGAEPMRPNPNYEPKSKNHGK